MKNERIKIWLYLLFSILLGMWVALESVRLTDLMPTSWACVLLVFIVFVLCATGFGTLESMIMVPLVTLVLSLLMSQIPHVSRFAVTVPGFFVGLLIPITAAKFIPRRT